MKSIAIDGNSLFYRMYYATKNQLEYAIKNGWKPNNGIKLMISTVHKLITENNYNYVFIAFDAGKKTFRHEMLGDYKSGRSETPDELIKQMNDSITLLEAMGYCVMSKEGIEADDLIGSYTKLMEKNNIECDVYSSDKDLLQLVTSNCRVNLLKTGISNIEVYDINNFESKFYGIKPLQVIDFKAIIGDKSDKLLGVNGIGEKTGVELIKKYGSLENIYENIDELSEKNKEKFTNSRDMAFLCKKMATILTDQFDNSLINDFSIRHKDEETINKIIKYYNLNKLDFLVQKGD